MTWLQTGCMCAYDGESRLPQGAYNGLDQRPGLWQFTGGQPKVRQNKAEKI